MPSDEKILITGPAGRIAFGLARSLVEDNEVWGIARFGDADGRAEVEALGVRTHAVDLASGDFGDLPSDFTYLLHVAADLGTAGVDQAMRVNAEGTGFILRHCRRAKAALVMSTLSVYKPHPDPWHAFVEDDPLGDQLIPSQPSYSTSKIAEEAVARYCSRSLELPVTIARMGAAYSDRGGLPLFHLDSLAEGEPVRLRWDPLPYSPIHDDDICAHLAPLLDAATVPATVVNYCGDVAVDAHEWTHYMAELLGVEARIEVDPVPGASVGSVGDPTRRIAITGPGTVDWRTALDELVRDRHPDRVAAE